MVTEEDQYASSHEHPQKDIKKSNSNKKIDLKIDDKHWISVLFLKDT